MNLMGKKYPFHVILFFSVRAWCSF